MYKTFPEEAQIVSLMAPAADAAGRASRAASLKHAHKAYIVLYLNQGNAATIALTPEQCTSVAGAGNKAIPAVPIWTDLDAAASSVLTRQADAVSFTTDGTVKEKIVIFEIDPVKLDIANGYDCVRVSTGASNAANITSAFLVVPYGRFGGVTTPNALVD